MGIINEALARSLFGNRRAVGRHFSFRRQSVEVVGVVSDGMYNTMREKRGWRMFYVPYLQDQAHLFSMCVVVRVANTTPALKVRIRDEIRSVEPNLPVLKINSISEQIDRSLLVERLVASISAFFGLAAVFLACLGLYGVVSYAAARRTNEIGVRMALGATRTDVVAMILRDSLLLALAGALIGIPAALAATRLVSSRLFGVSAADPVTFTAAAALMTAVAVLSGFLPARRAAQTDPAGTLRCD